MRIGRILLVLVAATSPAFALSNRVFVKSTGMDVGTCPLTAPCRSFSYAMTQVAASGEVIALDTAGYGTFTISQAVSVFAPNGVTAFIAVTSGTGIDITAGAGDAIILRGLALSSNGGANGIVFSSGNSLALEHCIINGFTNFGIDFARNMEGNFPRVRIENSTIRYNSTGIRTLNTGSAPPQGGPPPGTAGLTMANSSLSENLTGLLAGDNTRAAVSDTVISGNGTGVAVGTAANLSYPDVSLERCTITQNSVVGILAGTTAVVRIAHDLITGNNLGVQESGGIIASLFNGSGYTNTIEGNATNGTYSAFYTAK